ncbi:hypothetical protein SUDANB6_00732 [Streptomyces sp. enrichment culture]
MAPPERAGARRPGPAAGIVRDPARAASQGRRVTFRVFRARAPRPGPRAADAALIRRSWPISDTFFISSAFTQAGMWATVCSGSPSHGNGAVRSRSASVSRSAARDHSSRRPRSQATAASPGPGHVIPARPRGVRPDTWSAATPSHQPMCQLSQPTVGTGTGSGSVSAQSGTHLPVLSRRMVQQCGAGSHRKSSASRRSAWYSKSDHVRSHCHVISSHREVGTGRRWHTDTAPAKRKSPGHTALCPLSGKSWRQFLRDFFP